MTEISFEEYEMMMEIAERDGLCPNCFHTLACCDGKCPRDVDQMEHVCAKN